MALHAQLPIYREAYKLLGLLVKLTRNIPRDLKRSIGEKLRDESIEILVLVCRANVHRDKVPYLVELVERVQVIELMLRLSKDLRLITPAQHADAVELTRSIGKQATGWKKRFANAPAT